jgi:hypothetical protein
LIQNIVFWWIVPASYTLVRSESKSEVAALSATALVPLTPLLWPLVWNDFRELQLAIPFVFWAVQGVRGRNPGLAAMGIVVLLACRQEFAVMVATFAFLPARQPENLTTTLNWRQALLALGLAWLLFAFFGYLRFMVAPHAPEHFIDQFLGPKASVAETLGTSADFLVWGIGAWAAFALLVPRVAILAVPWIWSLCNGRWALRYLATEEWHHVRYTVPPLAMTMAAGLIGYSRLSAWLAPRRGGWAALALVWTLTAISFAAGLSEMAARMARIPQPISFQEAEAINYWISQVGPTDGVLATYEVTAPLSSRRWLFSYILEQNKPKGFPNLGPELSWVFIRTKDFDPTIFLDQGFEIVQQGLFVTIFRRHAPTL